MARDSSSSVSALDLTSLVVRESSFFLRDGGVPYHRGGGPSAEPTLLAALALHAAGDPAGRTKPLLDWARKLQNPDGSIGINHGQRDQGIWLTAVLAIALFRLGPKENLRQTLDFVLSVRSVTVPTDPRMNQDSTLAGWPWVRGTFGWVEPTAWAVIALSLAGLGHHPRTVEGRKFLLDRQIASGGWNYGSPSLDSKELLPFWDTTGLALVALKGSPEAQRVRPSLALLEHDQDKIESLSGLAWATLGLQSYGMDVHRMKAKLKTVMSSMPEPEINSANFSLGLIALSDNNVFIP